MERKTPQEKKRLSYAKDRRNTYGENDKSSRKNIRRRKRHPNRSNRRTARQPPPPASRSVRSSRPDGTRVKSPAPRRRHPKHSNRRIARQSLSAAVGAVDATPLEQVEAALKH